MVQECGWIQLAKGFEANKNISDQDDAKVVAHEPLSKIIAGANFDVTHTASLTADVWSETKTAQLIKGLKIQAPPPKHTPQLQKKPVGAFPALSEPSRIGTKAAVSGVLKAEATQFWSCLTERIGSAVEETAVDSSQNTEELRAEMVRTKTGRNRSKRRWTPLRF